MSRSLRSCAALLVLVFGPVLTACAQTRADGASEGAAALGRHGPILVQGIDHAYAPAGLGDQFGRPWQVLRLWYPPGEAARDRAARPCFVRFWTQRCFEDTRLEGGPANEPVDISRPGKVNLLIAERGGVYVQVSVTHKGPDGGGEARDGGVWRLDSDARFLDPDAPKAQKDARRAIQYLRANAERLGIDPERIHVISVGSESMAAAWCFAGDGAEPEAIDPVARVSSLPNGWLALRPLTWWPVQSDGYRAMGLLGIDKHPFEGRTLGEVDPRERRELSPLHFLFAGPAARAHLARIPVRVLAQVDAPADPFSEANPGAVRSSLELPFDAQSGPSPAPPAFARAVPNLIVFDGAGHGLASAWEALHLRRMLGELGEPQDPRAALHDLVLFHLAGESGPPGLEGLAPEVLARIDRYAGEIDQAGLQALLAEGLDRLLGAAPGAHR